MINKYMILVILCIVSFISSIPEQKINNKLDKICFDRYHRYEHIQGYLNNLQLTHKNIVEVKNYGLSVEQRNLTYIKISSKGKINKPLIFIDAGIHAREWIAIAQALYIIHQLVENPENQKMVYNVDWLIVPLVNPDGYEYTHTVNRYWRKNRAKGANCKGVDLNRNFDYKWSTVDASDWECYENYAGTRPFSEPESLALSTLIMVNAKQIKLYISFHSPSKAILYPWSHSNDLPENQKELYHIASHMVSVINKVDSATYRIGTFANILYLGSGTSMDWVYAVANISLAFTIELVGGNHTQMLRRFLIPPRDILSVVDAMFQGVKLLPRHLLKYSSYFVGFRRLSLP